MDSVEILKDVARRPLDEAESLRSALTPAVLNAHPGHDNSPAWLLWHAAREIDEQLSALTGEEPVWTRSGFESRFNLGLDRHDMGLGHSGAQARAVQIDDAELLLQHLRAVVEAQLAYLDTLTEARLGEIIDEQWDPPVARGARLVSISLDALAHVSQAAYVVGMEPAAREG